LGTIIGHKFSLKDSNKIKQLIEDKIWNDFPGFINPLDLCVNWNRGSVDTSGSTLNHSELKGIPPQPPSCRWRWGRIHRRTVGSTDIKSSTDFKICFFKELGTSCWLLIKFPKLSIHSNHLSCVPIWRIDFLISSILTTKIHPLTLGFFYYIFVSS
jgi:hypothetical protein